MPAAAGPVPGCAGHGRQAVGSKRQAFRAARTGPGRPGGRPSDHAMTRA